MNEEILKLLRCVEGNCNGSLDYIESSEKTLVCKSCNHNYKFIHDIPILMSEESFQLFNKRYWDKEKEAESYTEKYNKYLKNEGNPWGQYTHDSEIYGMKRLLDDNNFNGRDKIIVDCGSGNGRFLSLYEDASIKLAIDTSIILLKNSKLRDNSLNCICADIQKLPIKDYFADLSISIRVFQHLKNPEKAFSEMSRITKPEGLISVQVYNKFNLKEIYKRLRMLKFVQKIKPWALKYDRYYSFLEINSWARDNLIKNISWSGSGWGIHFYLFEIIKFKSFNENFQRKIFNFFLFLEKILGKNIFVSKTLEKVTFLGSMQSKQNKENFNLLSKLKKFYLKKKINNKIKDFEKKNLNFISDDKTHLLRSIDWIKNAQDAFPDGGISRAYNLHGENFKSNPSGWQLSYPETSGYILPSLIKANNFLADENLNNRIYQLGDFLMQMSKEGKVKGGSLNKIENYSVFDTGQVLRGLIEYFKISKNENILQNIKECADFICNSEIEKSGRFSSNNLAKNSIKYINNDTVNVYIALPLAQVSEFFNDVKYKDLSKRIMNYTITRQNQNGYFENADFYSKENTLTHNIGYIVEGLIETSLYFSDEANFNKVNFTLNKLSEIVDKNKDLISRYDNNWKPVGKEICITGSAQIAISLLKSSNFKKNSNFEKNAIKITERLKEYQNNYIENFGGGIGAMWGSWPISGSYQPFESINWANKFFIDLLNLKIKNIN